MSLGDEKDDGNGCDNASTSASRDVGDARRVNNETTAVVGRREEMTSDGILSRESREGKDIDRGSDRGSADRRSNGGVLTKVEQLSKRVDDIISEASYLQPFLLHASPNQSKLQSQPQTLSQPHATNTCTSQSHPRSPAPASTFHPTRDAAIVEETNRRMAEKRDRRERRKQAGSFDER
jgi:hypothetical protein